MIAELFRKAGEYHITINRTQEHYEAPIVCCVRKIFVYLQPPPVKTKIGEYKESNNSGCQILLDIFIRNGYGHTSLVAFDYVRIRAQSLRTIRTFPTHLIRMRSDSELFRSFFLRMERQDKHLFHRFLSKSFLEI